MGRFSILLSFTKVESLFYQCAFSRTVAYASVLTYQDFMLFGKTQFTQLLIFSHQQFFTIRFIRPQDSSVGFWESVIQGSMQSDHSAD